MARKLAIAVGVLWLMASDMPARAQVPAQDYAADSRAWNGLATFVALARGLGLEVDATAAFHWDEIGDGDILVVLYPTGSMPGSEIAAFVRGGGRLVIADDFGGAGELFARLGVLRERVKRADDEHRFGGLGYTPIATVNAPGHPLADGISRIVTNHPAALIHEGEQVSVFSLAGGESAVIAATFGRGRFVALSDPSMLINRMLELPDNLRFAVNLIRYLADDSTQRVVVVTGDFSAYGDPEPVALADPTHLAADRVNGFFYSVSDYLFTSPGARWAAILGALALATAAALTLPLRRRPVPDESFTRVTRRGIDMMRTALTDASPPRLVLPAAIIRDTVNGHLAGLARVPDPLAELSDRALLTAVGQRAGAQAESALAAILPILRKVPPRAALRQAQDEWLDGMRPKRISRRDFDRISDGATAFYRSLGRHP